MYTVQLFDGTVIGEFVSVVDAILFAVDVDAMVVDESGKEVYSQDCVTVGYTDEF